MTNKEAIEKLQQAGGIVCSEYMGVDDKLVDEVNEAVNLAIVALEEIEKAVDFLRSAVNIKMALESSLEIEKHNKNVMIKRIIADITDLKALSSTTIMNNYDLLDFVLEIIDKHRKESEDD